LEEFASTNLRCGRAQLRTGGPNQPMQGLRNDDLSTVMGFQRKVVHMNKKKDRQELLC
jgi:hypothetical protein